MKRQLTKGIAYGFATILASVMFGSTASASSRGPLYEASDHYRDTVCDFEDHVLRLRYIEREDRRLVDQLEDATSRLRSDSRRASDLDPRDLDRLNCTWDEIERLHHAVETALFERPCYPRNPALEACWARVDVAHRQFALVLDRANAIAAEQQACLYDHPQQRISPHSVPPQVIAPVPYESYRQSATPFPGHRSPAYRSMGQERYFGRQTYGQPSLQRSDSRDVGAALVGALLSRVLQ